MSVKKISLTTIFIFVFLSIWKSETADLFFTKLQNIFATNVGWYYILISNVYIILILIFLFGKAKNLKLGAADEKPQYSLWAWFAMLFSAGMGIGLIFYGVAEPILHYINPPLDLGTDLANAKQAISVTFYHWGLHAWSLYALTGLVLAYFAFRSNKPFSISAALEVLFNRKFSESQYSLVNSLAVIATSFGLATTLSYGALQISSGLNFVFAVPESKLLNFIIVAVVIFIASMSVLLGMDKGVKRLSEINLVIASTLLCFVFVFASKIPLMDSFVENLGYYIEHFVHLSTWTEAYESTNWQNGWTIFYLSWWIAWAPFVGMFIAKISRGRTIREFILGVIIVPTLVTFFWINTFGTTALGIELFGDGNLHQAVQENISTAIFVFLDYFPFAKFTSSLAVVSVIIFFVTSADSGAIVLDILATKGQDKEASWDRVFWCLVIGAISAILLNFGGMHALQTASILFALPFSFVLLCMGIGLLKEIYKSNKDSSGQ